MVKTSAFENTIIKRIGRNIFEMPPKISVVIPAYNESSTIYEVVTRAQLDKMQGGFIQQAFGDMRGLIMVRSDQGNKTWIANSRVRNPENKPTELEDFMKGAYSPGGLPFRETISPPRADSLYCFPAVYLDYALISGRNLAPNLGRFLLPAPRFQTEWLHNRILCRCLHK